MKVDVEKFTKQLDALTEQAFELGYSQKEFAKSITDRIAGTWLNRQLKHSNLEIMRSTAEAPQVVG